MSGATRGSGLLVCLVASVGLSLVYESLFLFHGLNAMDEGWPLYAARSVLEGAELYHEALWVFPPGHLLPALLGVWLAPPGLEVARFVYAFFAVAATAGIVLLAARLMAWPWVLLTGLLVAVAAPDSHIIHAVFGYRYIVFAIAALLCFDRYIATRRAAWLVAAGAWIGVGGVFRLGPVFAAGCGLGVAIMSLSAAPRDWLRDWGRLGLGVLATLGVSVLGLGLAFGFDTLWRETVIRPATMLADQSLPWPPASFPTRLDRAVIRDWFIALQFRLLLLLYVGALAWLALDWLRGLARRRPFEQPLLLAVAVWGAVYFLRSLTRSDVAHLDSVLPPAFLLLAWAVGRGVEWLWPGGSRGSARAVHCAVVAGVFFSWGWLMSTDLYFTEARRGVEPLASTEGRIRVGGRYQARLIDSTVEAMRSAPAGEAILDMSASPMLFVLSGRRGPGGLDVVMPGTFLVPEEESGFLARLEADPPPLVVWPLLPFDGIDEQVPERYAPRISDFVHGRYAREGPPRRWFVMRPNASAEQRERQREGSLRARRRFQEMSEEEMSRHRAREH